jgi:hypothetical protein
LRRTSHPAAPSDHSSLVQRNTLLPAAALPRPFPTSSKRSLGPSGRMPCWATRLPMGRRPAVPKPWSLRLRQRDAWKCSSKSPPCGSSVHQKFVGHLGVGSPHQVNLPANPLDSASVASASTCFSYSVFILAGAAPLESIGCMLWLGVQVRLVGPLSAVQEVWIRVQLGVPGRKALCQAFQDRRANYHSEKASQHSSWDSQQVSPGLHKEVLVQALKSGRTLAFHWGTPATSCGSKQWTY